MMVAPVAVPSTAPSPCRRPSVGPARLYRRRQSARDRPGELFATPLGGLFLGPFREPVPP